MNALLRKTRTSARTSAGVQAASADQRVHHGLQMISGLLIVTLTGCAVGPEYVPPTMALPQTYKDQRTLNSTENKLAPSLDSWWAGFYDPQLVRIIERVLAQNLDLAAAISRIHGG